MSKDQYDILETIGSGSFGTVCKIKRKSDDKVLVWKEINFGTMSEKEKSQLVSEVNIIRELNNPFIVKYHDRIVDKARTRIYIIMEYCSGGDLGKLISKCRRERTNIDEALIWKILGQSIVALKSCHRRVDENGIRRPTIHRDLKPANMLLDSNQNIKIADFGLAKELSNHTRFAQTNVGTPLYMAPEIINERDYDERADIWSLGCVLYELAAQKPPFDAHNAVSLAMKINAGKFLRIPSKYSDTLFDVIKGMLQLDVRKRSKIEDLEEHPAVQSALNRARQITMEHDLQQTLAIKQRELTLRENQLKVREEELNRRERAINEKERELQQWNLRLESMEQLQQNRAISAAGQMVMDKEVIVSANGNTSEVTNVHSEIVVTEQIDTVFQRVQIPKTTNMNRVVPTTNAPFAIHCDESDSTKQRKEMIKQHEKPLLTNNIPNLMRVNNAIMDKENIKRNVGINNNNVNNNAPGLGGMKRGKEEVSVVENEETVLESVASPLKRARVPTTTGLRPQSANVNNINNINNINNNNINNQVDLYALVKKGNLSNPNITNNINTLNTAAAVGGGVGGRMGGAMVPGAGGVGGLNMGYRPSRQSAEVPSRPPPPPPAQFKL